MKKKYLKMLDELAKELGDSESTEAVDFLIEKVNEHNWLTLEDSSSVGGTQYPLPKEVCGLNRALVAFSDGACRGNPGPGAWGIMGQDISGQVIFEASGVDTRTTNNRMELEGAIEGLKAIKDYSLEHNGDLNVPVFLYSDSKYVVDGIEKWVPGWKSRGWKKADKKVPENVELWQNLDELYNSFPKLKFLWVKGHAGHPQNEQCDKLANVALDEAGF